MNLDLLKLLRIRLKEIVYDLIVLLLSGFLTSLIINLTYPEIHAFFVNRFGRDYDIFPLSLYFCGILLWLFFYFLFKHCGSWIKNNVVSFFHTDFGFSGEKEEYLTLKRLSEDFIFQGNISVKKGSLIITNSHAGCLIQPKPNFLFLNIGLSKIWKNFKANIEVDFIDQYHHQHLDNCLPKKFKKILGIVFRAQDFDNYFLLELCKEDNDLVIRPHTRVNAEWDAPEMNPDFNVLKNVFKKNSNKLKLMILAKDELVIIQVKKICFTWIIPSHVDPNLRRLDHNSDNLSKLHVGEITFRNQPGMFGFRNYGNELAVINSLRISKLKKEDILIIEKNKTV